jgi:tRNA(Ile)-lysidine synthase
LTAKYLHHTLITMENIVNKVEEFIKSNALIEKGERVLLSLSAGKDSMFLFHVMMELAPRLKFGIGVFHLNHLTRGEESDLDEQHVARLASEQGVELFIERHDFTKDAGAGTSFEARARNARYSMLEETARSNGFDKIATAHTSNDQVETVLMRIFTGTGVHGLQGIPVRRDNIIRPLLHLSSDEIYGFLKKHGIKWREDSSNTDISYARNFIRHEIIPLAQKRFPMLSDSIQSLGAVAGDAVRLINDMASEKFGALREIRGDALHIDADRMVDNYPLFCHVVSTAIRDNFNHHVSRSLLKEIYAKYRVKRANVSIFGDSEIKVEKVFDAGSSRLVISENKTAVPESPDWEYAIDVRDFTDQIIFIKEIGLSITIRMADYDYFLKYYKNKSYIFVTVENKWKSLYIRNRRRGDRIRTEQGTKKIKDLLIDKKIENTRKKQVPILVADKTVIACMPGFLFDSSNRVASDFLVDKKAKKVLAVFKNE